MRPFSLLAFVAILSASGFASFKAQAGTTLWKIDEVYSNIDGTVQFVDFFTTANGQNQLHSANLPGGLTLASGANTFAFPTDLPSAQTANHHFLVATPGYAALPHVPAPNYLLPQNLFFDPPNDTLTFAGVNSFDFMEERLPTDGVNALFRTGAIGRNLATNFAGDSGSVTFANTVPLPPAIWAAAPILILCAARWLARRPRVVSASFV